MDPKRAQVSNRTQKLVIRISSNRQPFFDWLNFRTAKSHSPFMYHCRRAVLWSEPLLVPKTHDTRSQRASWVARGMVDDIDKHSWLLHPSIGCTDAVLGCLAAFDARGSVDWVQHRAVTIPHRAIPKSCRSTITDGFHCGLTIAPTTWAQACSNLEHGDAGLISQARILRLGFPSFPYFCSAVTAAG